MKRERLLELAGVQLDENKAALQKYKDKAEDEGLEGLWEIASHVVKDKSLSDAEKVEVLYGLISWQEGG